MMSVPYDIKSAVKSEAKYLIYGLVDPRTLMVRYVGKSATGMYRAIQHKWRNKARTHKERWIAQLKREGLCFEVAVLQRSTPETLNSDEQWWIQYGRASGWPLTNLTDGGDGGEAGYRWTEEQRQKLKDSWSPERRQEYRERKLGTKASAEGKAKLSASLKAFWAENPDARTGFSERGKALWVRPGFRSHMIRVMTGQKRSADAKANMSRAQQNLAPELKAKRNARMRLYSTTRTFSKETRAKMRAAKLGKKQPDELIAKRVAKLTGQKRSEEIRKKYSEIQQARFAGVTHCPHGHEYTPDNLRNRPGKGRECKRCHYDAVARRNRIKMLGKRAA